MKTYSTSHSELTFARPEHIWPLWEDIGSWPEWDVGLSSTSHDSDFAAGSRFQLTPRGAPSAVEVELVEVDPGRRFVDETRLPFGTIRATHEVAPEGDRYRVTHRIDAEVQPDHAAMFENVIWSGMELGVPQSVANLVRMAEAKSGSPG
jgi:hypothetical protein